MKTEIRANYANNIADAIRFTMKETGLEWPEETILIVKRYSPLAEIDEIVGLKIFVSDMPSSFEYFVAFPSCHQSAYKLQKAWSEYHEIYNLL